MTTDEKGASLFRQQNLMPAACIVFGVWVMLAIFSSRCLYADGSYYFIKTLQARDFVSFMWSRHFADYIYELPLVLAIKLGVTNMALLRFAFGLGCFLPWPLVLLCCHWVSPKHFWVAALGCAAGYLNACYMAVGEHILAHAFFWSSLYVIVFARPLTRLAALILLGSATGLLFSYESQLFLGLPLAALSFWRVVEEKRDQAIPTSAGKMVSWIILVTAGGLFLAASGIGLYAVLRPEIPSNFLGFRTNVETLLFQKGWTLTWSLIWGCLMLSVWLSEKSWKLICRPAGMTVLLIALTGWGVAPLLTPHVLDPARQYSNRVLELVVPLLLLPVVLLIRYRPAWIETKSARLVQMTAVLLLVQSVWQIGATWQWQQDVGKLQGILSSRTGVIPLNSTILATSSIEAKNRGFDWTWPCLSIALNPDRQIRSLICSKRSVSPQYVGNFWQPFNPLKPEDLPGLQPYGLDFSDYITALAAGHAAK